MNVKESYIKLVNGKNLSEQEAFVLANGMMSQEFTDNQLTAIVTALKMKKETTKEITGFIKAMRKNMTVIEGAEEAIDTCGTGGDGAGTFNISTTVALVVAGAGVKVAKHGNRNASSMCGSADVMEALGVHITLTPLQAQTVLERVGCVFLFAPLFHSGLKQLGPIRKELGFRTIFNYLGPFCNPANVSTQLVGVPDKAIAKKLTEVAKTLGYTHLSIVTSNDGLDEISLSGKTVVYEIKRKKVKTRTLSPKQFDVNHATIKELSGGNAQENAAIITEILKGKKGPKREIVVVNAAYALFIANKVKTLKEGVELAIHSIDSGNAAAILQLLIQETQQYA